MACRAGVGLLGASKSEGIDPIGSTPDELRAHLAREIAKYARVIREAKITVK